MKKFNELTRDEKKTLKKAYNLYTLCSKMYDAIVAKDDDDEDEQLDLLDKMFKSQLKELGIEECGFFFATKGYMDDFYITTLDDVTYTYRQ